MLLFLFIPFPLWGVGNEKYPLQSKKILDFQDFLEVVKLLDSKQHLTLEGLNKIRVIKNGMNNSRK